MLSMCFIGFPDFPRVFCVFVIGVCLACSCLLLVFCVLCLFFVNFHRSCFSVLVVVSRFCRCLLFAFFVLFVFKFIWDCIVVYRFFIGPGRFFWVDVPGSISPPNLEKAPLECSRNWKGEPRVRVSPGALLSSSVNTDRDTIRNSKFGNGDRNSE